MAPRIGVVVVVPARRFAAFLRRALAGFLVVLLQLLGLVAREGLVVQIVGGPHGIVR